MTREEALKLLENEIYKWSMDWDEREDGLDYTEAIEIAIAALRHQIWEDQLWHDAKTDPPKTPGLYYGKKDDTNSMYACQYRDGVWVLDMYPQQKMDIVQWANYTAFVQDNVEPALRPVSREQVEKMWRGEWTPAESDFDDDDTLFDIDDWCDWQRSACHNEVCYDDPMERRWLPKFCPNCGAPMTDEAVQILLKRLEALHEVAE